MTKIKTTCAKIYRNKCIYVYFKICELYFQVVLSYQFKVLILLYYFVVFRFTFYEVYLCFYIKCFLFTVQVSFCLYSIHVIPL